MIRIFNHSVSKVVSGLLLVELIVLLASTYVGAALRFLDGTFPFTKNADYFFLTALTYAEPVALMRDHLAAVARLLVLLHFASLLASQASGDPDVWSEMIS